MASIRVTHDIDDLASDLGSIGVQFAAKAPRVVKKHANEGNTLARRFARAAAGPHGTNYYKRLSSEMTGPLSAEYGPDDPKTDFVGAGFRNGGPNMDLPNSADIIGPKFADAVIDLADGLFW